jgi:hypothetical protein
MARYVKTTWAKGDIITAAKLNHAESGIAAASKEVLLFKLAFKLQGQSGITADYIEANLNINEK